MTSPEVQEDIKTEAKYLMAIKGGARCFPYDSQRDRFDLLHSAETSIRPDLNANAIVINQENIAIATQFPYPYQIEAHLQMLVDNRTPVLVVLASATDMKDHKLPDYFSQNLPLGFINTTVEHLETKDLGTDIEAKIYNMSITGYSADVEVPVIHVHNWPDHQTVSSEATMNLVNLIESTIASKRSFYAERGSRAVNDPKRMLPVIHCRAGVGRTGQTIAAMVMQRNKEQPLHVIMRELRHSRNDFMVQTRPQMETLVEIDRNGRK